MPYFNLFVNQIKYSWSQKLGLQITTLLVLTGAFLVVSFSFLLGTNVRKAIVQVGDDVKVSVYLKSDNAEDVSRVKSVLNETNLFHQIKFVDKAGSLSVFKNKMRSIVPSFKMSESTKNPLPALFQMNIKPEFRSQASLIELERKVNDLLADDNIDDVFYARAFMEKYASFVNLYSTLSFAFVGFLFLCVFLIIGNLSKTSISMRREEIEVLELVGATRSYVRIPFIYEGAFMGFVSASIALAMSYFTFHSFKAYMAEKFDLSILNFEFSGLGFISSILIIGFAVAIGSLSAGLSVKKVNNGWAASKG